MPLLQLARDRVAVALVMSYNKGTQGARVGNWVEEEALKAVTGTHRYDTWATDAACEGTVRFTIGVRVRARWRGAPPCLPVFCPRGW